jgi:hypothetical protein
VVGIALVCAYRRRRGATITEYRDDAESLLGINRAASGEPEMHSRAQLGSASPRTKLAALRRRFNAEMDAPEMFSKLEDSDVDAPSPPSTTFVVDTSSSSLDAVPVSNEPPPTSLASALLGSTALRQHVLQLDEIISGAYIAAEAVFARHRAQHDPDAAAPLSLEETFAIMLYTWDTGSRPEQNFYHVLNHKCLREKDAGVVAALAPFLAVFDAALAKLRPRACETYRGIRVGSVEAEKQLRASYTVGGKVTFRGYTSVSADAAVAKSFQQGAAGVLFVITVVDAKAVARYSQFGGGEAELLLAPGASFTVVKTSGEIVLVQLATNARETVF